MQGYRTNAFKHDFVTSELSKKMPNSEVGGLDLKADVYGNPSYTVKEGGTLKKKMQGYAASKTERGGSFLPKEKLTQV